MPRAHAWRAADALVVAVMLATGMAQIYAGDAAWEGGRATHAVLLLAMTVPLLGRRRHAVTVFAAVVTAATVQYQLGGGLGQPFFAVVLALYSTGAHATGRASWIGPLAVLAFAVGVDVPRLRDGAPADEVVPAWFVLLGVWGLGRWVHHRHAETEALRRRADEAEERAAAAVRQERARIARELHDLVSHNIGVVTLQAQGAQRALDNNPEGARRALLVIERAAREGLTEMRHLLGFLRSPDDAPMNAPQPTLERLNDMVDQARAAGASVTLDSSGDLATVPSGVGLAAFRIAQEGVTNALKHAPGAAIAVSVTRSRDGVEVLVDNDAAEQTTAEGGGQGLIGIRERLSVYDGTLEAGPRPAGGYRLKATIPTEET